jgi:hypothetical protein
MSILTHQLEKNMFHISVLSIGFAEMIMSASRSAVFALFIALGVYLLLQKHKSIKIKTVVFNLFAILVLIILMIIKGDAVQEKIFSFILKYEKPGQIKAIRGSDVLATRADLLETSIKNFKDHPITGVGFNVQLHYSEAILERNWQAFSKYIPGTNILYSRPLEKGNVYTAVFEEGGIFVGLYFLYILFYLFYTLYQANMPHLWVPYLAMLANTFVWLFFL